VSPSPHGWAGRTKGYILVVLQVELGMVGGGQLDHLPLGCGGRMRSKCDLSTSEVWFWHWSHLLNLLVDLMAVGLSLPTLLPMAPPHIPHPTHHTPHPTLHTPPPPHHTTPPPHHTIPHHTTPHHTVPVIHHTLTHCMPHHTTTLPPPPVNRGLSHPSSLVMYSIDLLCPLSVSRWLCQLLNSNVVSSVCQLAVLIARSLSPWRQCVLSLKYVVSTTNSRNSYRNLGKFRY